MRLPLNNGGLINLDTAGQSETIFNTNDLLNDGTGVTSPDDIYLVTLYAYATDSAVNQAYYADVISGGVTSRAMALVVTDPPAPANVVDAYNLTWASNILGAGDPNLFKYPYGNGEVTVISPELGAPQAEHELTVPKAGTAVSIAYRKAGGFDVSFDLLVNGLVAESFLLVGPSGVIPLTTPLAAGDIVALQTVSSGNGVNEVTFVLTVETQETVVVSSAGKNNIGLVKMLDKLVCRGDMQVVVGLEVGANSKTSFFGYYERAGERDTAKNYRPFQPTNVLQPPFTPPWPKSFTVAANGNVDEVIQLLDVGYVDVVSLRVGVVAALGTTVEVEVVFPDGNSISVNNDPEAGGLLPTLVLDDIPLKALDSSNNTLRFRVAGQASPLLAYVDGHFTRS